MLVFKVLGKLFQDLQKNVNIMHVSSRGIKIRFTGFSDILMTNALPTRTWMNQVKDLRGNRFDCCNFFIRGNPWNSFKNEILIAKCFYQIIFYFFGTEMHLLMFANVF